MFRIRILFEKNRQPYVSMTNSIAIYIASEKDINVLAIDQDKFTFENIEINRLLHSDQLLHF